MQILSVAYKNVTYTLQGASTEFESSWGNGKLDSRLIGAFNVSNLLTAFAGLLALGYNFHKLLETAPHLTGVCGRMECLVSEQAPQANYSSRQPMATASVSLVV